MDKALILRYQELISNACPAKTTIFLNGWIIQLSEGVTKRANSVYPLRYTGVDLLKDIETAEALYKGRGLSTVFQISDYFEPDNLTKTLLSRGYQCVDETLVMTAGVEDICTTVNNKYTYSLEDESLNYWFQALRYLSGFNNTIMEGLETIMRRIHFPQAFFYAQENTNTIGIGRGVIEGEHMGIYSIIVHPQYQRKGIGQSIIDRIVEWGKSHSVRYCYLQVQDDNPGALSFYRKIGFEECTRYRYFVRESTDISGLTG